MPVIHTRLKDLYTVLNSKNQTRGQYKGSNPLEAAKKVFKKIVKEENIKECKFNLLNMSTGETYSFYGKAVRINKIKRIKTENGILEIPILHKYFVNQI